MAKTNKEKATQITAFEVLETLTESEERERHQLEWKVERVFYEAGTALRELRDRRLYRSTHRTFEAYCQDRFGFSRQNANYFIAGARVIENLLNLTTNCCQTLPTKEIQVRPLTTLEPLEQVMAWQQAVEEVGGKVPSGKTVKGIVERLKEKKLRLASEFCEVGDVFILKGLTQEERKYNGCWALAYDTEGITVGVDVHDRSLRVKPENLKPIDSPEIHRTLPAIHRRIKQLRKCGKLDRSTEVLLSHFGKQTYLTDFEDKLLTFMEQQHGISENRSTDSN